MGLIINPFSFGSGSSTPGDPGGASPSDVSGLQLWLKANNSTSFAGFADGDQITTWHDSSGNGRNATGAAISTIKPKWKPTEGPNSYPAILLTDGWFNLPNFLTGFTAGNVFCVVKLAQNPISLADTAPPVSNWGTPDSNAYDFAGNQLIYEDWGTNSRKDAIDHTGKSLTAWHVYEIRTASGAWSNHYNGVQLFSTGSNTVAWGTAPNIGRTDGGATFLRGWVTEIIFYNSVLSSADRWATPHTYLNNKYAFSLPTS